LADLKVFEDRKADEIAVETAFAAAKQETEAKLAQREAAVREGEAKLIANLEEVQATRITLKEKLDKIKSITAG
jgi:prophage DNA circulation protein